MSRNGAGQKMRLTDSIGDFSVGNGDEAAEGFRPILAFACLAGG